MLEVVCPDVHKYVFAPEAVSVALDPLQMVEEGLVVMAGVGKELTVMEIVEVAEHPPLNAVKV